MELPGQQPLGLASLNATSVAENLALRSITPVLTNESGLFQELVRLSEEVDLKCGLADEKILQSFSPTYLFNVVHFSPFETAPALLQRLRQALLARNDVQALERRMCKSYFKELMTTGVFCCGGVEKASGGLVNWIDSSALYHKVWSLKKGTPRGDAWCRAVLFFVDKAMRMGSDQPGAPCVQYVVESRRRILDFNLSCEAYVHSKASVLHPVRSEKVVIIGKFRWLSAALTQVKAILGDRMGNFEFIDDVSAVAETLTEKSRHEIPQFFLDGKSQGRPYTARDRRNVWCYDRLLCSDSDSVDVITTADVCTDTPWEYPEFDYSTLERKQSTQDTHEGEESDCAFEDDAEDDW